VDAAQLAFRDAPLYVMADVALEVIENIEGNNTRMAAASCAASGGGLQDLAICVDASYSIHYTVYQVEMEGIIAALQNPNIIPHDGSIRFTLDVAYNQVPLHRAVVITPATLPKLLNDLRTTGPNNWRNSGAYCMRYLSEYLLTLSPSTRKTLITMGDGGWEGHYTTVAMLPGTIANGIDRIDAIGIGSYDWNQLEANVWPKPANSPNGGRVTIANSTGEIAAALTQSISSLAQSPDLTLGNFRLHDQGAGQPVRLTLRVGNAGASAPASTVEIRQGASLLGSLAVPALRSGQWVDLQLETLQITGTDPLRATVDPQNLASECNRANNSQEIPLAASINPLAHISVATDQPSYPANTAVQLQSAITNQGSLAASLQVVLRVTDASGDEVVRFPPHNTGSIAAGATLDHTQPWNSAQYPAGSYTLTGTLIDDAGQTVGIASTLFAITAAGGAGAPRAALSLATDRAEYAQSDIVRIDNLVRNLTANARFDDARVEITVRDPGNAIVFTHTHQLGQLQASAIRQLDALQSLKNAPPGDYTVQAVLIGSGNSLRATGYAANVQLASASATYRVNRGSGPVPVPASAPWALALIALALTITATTRPTRPRKLGH
jgi:hypothetical protein